MKIKLNPRTIACALLVISIPALGQNKAEQKYQEQADAIRSEVWNWQKPAFANRAIPAQYASTSKVIIARHTQIVADSKAKANLEFAGVNVYPQSYATEITREVIKLNDKAAVEEYSQISFTKFSRTGGSNYGHITNAFIGVRVIKADGSVKEVNADESVLVKEEKYLQKAKLAVPELEVGDILDYFIATQQKIGYEGQEDVSSHLFLFFDDAPILYYSIHVEIGSKYAVEYRCCNGAPDFIRNNMAEGDNLLDMVIKNIPASAESGLWVSPFRQLPLIRLNIKKGRTTTRQIQYARQAGVVYANPPVTDFLGDLSNQLPSTQVYLELKNGMQDHYQELLRNKKRLSSDSVAAELYYLYRYRWFLDVRPNEDIDYKVNLASEDRNVVRDLWRFRSLLLQNQVGGNVVFTTSRYGPKVDDMLGVEDIQWLLQPGENDSKFMGISDLFSPPFYIPAEYEKTNGAVPHSEARDQRYSDKHMVSMPGTMASQNRRIETIDITPLPNGTELHVDRRTVLKGHYKSEVQKKLILIEDYCNSERKLLGSTNTITEELAAAKNKKSYAPELQAAFDQARSKQKDNFINEAKDWFGQPITGITAYKVVNMGVRYSNPDFIYSSKFNIGGLIKKAGNDLIIDIGKLQGTPLNISPSQRKRKLDIYMPFARSLQTEIVLHIPEGYTAEGVNELNKKVENETGYFIGEATTDGKTITIKVRKSYNHAYEPVGNWEKMLAFIDAANDWTNAKILLKKK